MNLKTCSVTIQIPEHRMNQTATLFIQRANAFKSDITVTQGGNNVNAKSLLGFLSLNPGTGDLVTLTANGPDEGNALETLRILLTTAERKI